jgi:hypothetical protein
MHVFLSYDTFTVIIHKITTNGQVFAKPGYRITSAGLQIYLELLLSVSLLISPQNYISP